MNGRLNTLIVTCAVAFSFFLVPSLFAGKDLSPREKQNFLEAICADLERTERCLSSGGLVLKLSINWIVFEACSWSGERPTAVKCFDRAAKLAAERTGDPAYLAALRHCHRFGGEHNEDAIVRCYRESFKYSDYNVNTFRRQGKG